MPFWTLSDFYFSLFYSEGPALVVLPVIVCFKLDTLMCFTCVRLPSPLTSLTFLVLFSVCVLLLVPVQSQTLPSSHLPTPCVSPVFLTFCLPASSSSFFLLHQFVSLFCLLNYPFSNYQPLFEFICFWDLKHSHYNSHACSALETGIWLAMGQCGAEPIRYQVVCQCWRGVGRLWL